MFGFWQYTTCSICPDKNQRKILETMMPVFLVRINQYQDVNIYTVILGVDTFLQLMNLKKQNCGKISLQ